METTLAGIEFPGRIWLRRVWRSLSRPGALAVLVATAAILSGTLTYFVMSGIGPFGPSPPSRAQARAG